MEKREWDGKGGEENEPEQKRQRIPALASVIVEALKVDCMQKLCSSLEPILRRVVSEEVERAIAKLGPARVGARSSPNRLEGPDGRNLQLHFRTRLSLPLFTGGKVEGEQGAAIHVVLLDASTGQVVTSGPESSAKLDVLVLDGDFSNEDDDSWTEEEFERYILKEREMKGPILTGQLQLSLKDGVGTLGDLTFMDNSSWTRSRKFRLGLRVIPGYSEGVRIREAKTEAFLVKDQRGESYKKHHPPSQKDEVWRLEKIAKDGSYHKKLNNAGIHTVEDFLRMALRDPLQLRRILGSGMSNKMWGILVDHAKTCLLSGKLYVYYDMQDVGAIFNNDYEFCGLIASGQYISADNLSDTQKVFADSLVKKAYDNWNRVVQYDGEVLLSSKGDGGASSSMAGVGTSSIIHPYDEQVSLPHLPCAKTDSGFALGGSAGYGDQSAGASFHTQYAAAEAHQLNSIPCASQDQFVGSSQLPLITRNNSTSLAVAPSLQTTLEIGLHDMPPQTSNLNPYDWQPQDNHAVNDMFSEDIRMRSHQMLEHEDMQQLLRAFTTGGVSANLAEDSFAFESYMQTPLPSDDQGRSGKAVVGWLKIKAAMRWGIFIRRKAAERRAQIVELDD